MSLVVVQRRHLYGYELAMNVTGGKRKEGRENIGYKRHYSVCHGYKRYWREFALNLIRMEFMAINVITFIARERWWR
jgi:hypothetical protein